MYITLITDRCRSSSSAAPQIEALAESEVFFPNDEYY